LSAILSRQLQESVEAASPDGWVRVTTRAEEVGVHIDIQDSRPPIPAQDLVELFEPSFQVSDGRVATGNWIWFNARQIIREHGGELSVISDGAGTTTTVTLPWRPSPGL
jgi:signal transduction histidine kinase